MRILLAEDERSLSKAIVTILRKNNYEVDPVYDGQDAIDYLENGTYDGAILDIMMPRMDGLTLIKNLRGMPQYAKTPILMLTTESSDAMKAQGRAAGATGWLVKPFDPQKLIEVVRKVIG